MRPETLFIVFSDAGRLKGVGAGLKKALSRLITGREGAEVTLRDLAFHLPSGVIDRHHTPALAKAQEGDVVSLAVMAAQYHLPPPGRGPLPGRRAGTPTRVVCHSAEGVVNLVFFHLPPQAVQELLPLGQARMVSGRFERFQQQAQITHPDIIVTPEAWRQLPASEPVYPLCAGLSGRLLRRIITQALALMPDLPEWQDAAWRHARGDFTWKAALQRVHQPETLADLLPTHPARERLAYDELLAAQLALALLRSHMRGREAAVIPSSLRLRAALEAVLPYTLTSAQRRAILEIDADLASGTRMVRMLQGDVGSGKTITAFYALLSVMEAGAQGVLMAPTEVLASQHAATLRPLCDALGLEMALLTSRLKKSERDALLARLASGDIQLLIGTHAVFQDQVQFKALGLAVIDEQHRFGVEQRLKLARKSPATHLLVMTATPIPRSLAMTAYGDMESSALDEKPAGRLPITTRAVPMSRSEEVIQAVARALERGEKVYWICPMVEEKEEELPPGANALDLAAATSRYTEFTHRFAGLVALAHGQMEASALAAMMASFTHGPCQLLVATTIVEVGVDVQSATIMVIEQAERFGLAQLHQLRGRVGRGAAQSHCILLYADRCSSVAQARLRAIRESNDGFHIAEEDLRLRGGGELLGVRQSGLPAFRFADLAQHAHLLRAARDDARLILHQDPKLASPRGQALRVLLHLFRYEENIRYAQSG